MFINFLSLLSKADNKPEVDSCTFNFVPAHNVSLTALAPPRYGAARDY